MWDVAPATTAHSPGLPLATLKSLCDVPMNRVGTGESIPARPGVCQGSLLNGLSAQALPRTRDPLPVADSTPEAE